MQFGTPHEGPLSISQPMELVASGRLGLAARTAVGPLASRRPCDRALYSKTAWLPRWKPGGTSKGLSRTVNRPQSIFQGVQGVVQGAEAWAPQEAEAEQTLAQLTRRFARADTNGCAPPRHSCAAGLKARRGRAGPRRAAACAQGSGLEPPLRRDGVLSRAELRALLQTLNDGDDVLPLVRHARPDQARAVRAVAQTLHERGHPAL